MSKHIADHISDRTKALRAREYARIERAGKNGGPHPTTRMLQRRPVEVVAPGRRAHEFLRRERYPNA